MAATKKNTYIEYDIEWLRKKVDELKQYVDDHPFHTLKDRIGEKVTARGGVIPYVIQNIEGQLKVLKDILKDLPIMLAAIDALEEKEHDKKKTVKGDAILPERMMDREDADEEP